MKNQFDDTQIQAFAAAKEQTEDFFFKTGLDAGAAFLIPENYLKARRLARWRKDAGKDVSILVGRKGVLGIMEIMNRDSYSETEAELRELNGDDVDENSWLYGFVEGAVQRFYDIEARL